MLGACATEGPPVAPAGVEQKVGAARTRADHQELAAIYEREAKDDKTAVERHRSRARSYEVAHVGGGGGGGGGVGPNPTMAAHCENLARLYQQAAEENIALEKEHRKMAAAATN